MTTGYIRINITLSQEETKAFRKLTNQTVRTEKELARYIIRQYLINCGALQVDNMWGEILDTTTDTIRKE